MSVLKNIVIVVVVLAAFGFVCSAACFATPIQMIQNGSFESIYWSSNGQYGFSLPSSSPYTVTGGATPTSAAPIAYWTVGKLIGGTGDGFGWVNVGSQNGQLAEDQNVFINLLGAYSRFCQQTFSVLAGQTYTASFWQAYRDSNCGVGATLSVQLGDRFRRSVERRRAGDLDNERIGQ